MAQGDPVYVSGTSPKYLEIRTLLGARTNFTTWGTVQIQAGEFREKQHKQYESLNKRLVTIIGKQQGGG